MNSRATMPSAIPPTRKAVITAASRYRRHSYGDNHPLGIPRVSLTLDLIEAYGALGPGEYVDSRKAQPFELEWFHTRAYVSAMQRCEAVGKVYDRYRQRHNIGNLENPYFPDFFATPATATGGSLIGAEAVLDGRIAFSPAGGMHHARADSAQGFCFFNDPVLAIMRLRRAGLRVLYLDIDAHHGDGVEAGCATLDEVVTCSLHMDTEYAYPFSGGGIEDRGPRDAAVNLPLPRGVNDSEYRHVFERLWPAVLAAARPDVIVLQAGTDMLGADPLGKFTISTQLFLEVAARVLADAPRHADGTPRLLALGGGGYHPLLLARCWAGLWALLSGRELAVEIPPEGQALLRAVDWDLDEDEDHFESLFLRRLDTPQEGPVREAVRGAVDRLLSSHPLLR